VISASQHSPPAALASRAGVQVAGLALLLVALAAAVSVDFVRAAYGIKSDEATYAAMTLSVAYDHDLTWERHDLERFVGLYQQGPEGIFLKRGKRLHLRISSRPPFIQIVKFSDPRSDRLYYGKAMVYGIVAAPFVRLFGMNGFLVLHVLLIAAVCACGYWFLSATSAPAAALTFTLAFVGVSVVPVYGIFVMPDLLNFALVFVGYFLWLYKEAADPRSGALRGITSDLWSAVLLATATYSKPTNGPIVAPLIALMLWRRQWRRAFATALVFGAVTAGWFGVNALVTGEFNYQGGDRKTFYGSFPFEASGRDVWNEKTELVTTNDADTGNVLEPGGIANRLGHNIEYFLIGRHFGFVPYFFPGVVALLAWALSRQPSAPHRLLVVVGGAGAALLLLLFLPYTWSGGGGPPGNRYFLSLYPVLFFIVPQVRSWHGLLAVAGGALFTAKILVNPFVTAKNTWEIAQRGLARRLPVELTMANDLPVMLQQPPRGHIPYGGGSTGVLLYFLDPHAFPPEPVGKAPDGSTLWGIWVSGSGRAEIIVRTAFPMDHLQVEAESLVRTDLTMTLGTSPVSMTIVPRQVARFDLKASGVQGLNDYNYLLTARSTEAFVPHLVDPNSRDYRNLGAQIRFKAVPR
jgi:hypothetical protein